jgi:hypothetical protein
MSKRKPATASKHARHPNTVAKAQRAAQAVVRSPKDERLRSARAGTTESTPKPDDRQPQTFVENPATALQDDPKQTTAHSEAKELAHVSLAGGNAGAYQSKLLEMTQANMQFAFEFSQRLATMRLPVEFPSVIGEFTSKRIAMFWKHSREMAELSTKGWTA